MKQIDQHLKERLVGAAVLVVLGMVLIPLLLDGPPADEPVRVGVELPVPDRDGKPSQTIRIDVPADRPAAGGIRRPAESPPAPRVEPAASGNPANTTAKAAEPPPAELASESPEPAVPKQKSKPEAPEARPEPAAVTPPEGGWVVQLGSFSNRDNAIRLTGDLEKLGFDAHVDEAVSGGRTWYRVRVGPLPGKDEAQAMATRLKAAGHPGKVISNGG